MWAIDFLFADFLISVIKHYHSEGNQIRPCRSLNALSCTDFYLAQRLNFSITDSCDCGSVIWRQIECVVYAGKFCSGFFTADAEPGRVSVCQRQIPRRNAGWWVQTSSQSIGWKLFYFKVIFRRVKGVDFGTSSDSVTPNSRAHSIDIRKRQQPFGGENCFKMIELA